MPRVDVPLGGLVSYLPERDEPADFAGFWAATLADAGRCDTAPTVTPYDAGLTLVDVHDVRFPGFGGHPVAGGLLVPAGAHGPLPCVVGYLGSGGGRGFTGWIGSSAHCPMWTVPTSPLAPPRPRSSPSA